jgi:hypothetical protein
VVARASSDTNIDRTNIDDHVASCDPRFTADGHSISRSRSGTK